MQCRRQYVSDFCDTQLGNVGRYAAPSAGYLRTGTAQIVMALQQDSVKHVPDQLIDEAQAA